MKTSLYIAVLGVLVLSAGCFKDVSYKTNYIINPETQAVTGAAGQPITDFRAYAFAADTADWTVASYEDAVAGILTSKENPAEKNTTPIATSAPYESKQFPGRFVMNLSKTKQMVVAVDLQDKLYAYTQQKLGANLPNLYVALTFRPWKELRSYKEGLWSYYNRFYIPPKVVNFYVDPKTQETEGGESVAPESIKAYAFIADTTEWRIASFKDAVNGIITSKYDFEATRNNSIPATEDADGLYRMKITGEVIMVVVVDKKDSLYAYREQGVSLESEPVTVPLTFRPWMKQALYVEDGWRVVDKFLEPEPPVTPVSKRIR